MVKGVTNGSLMITFFSIMKAKEQPKEAQKEKSCQNGLPNFLGWKLW
jgi:hypothetical protein